MVAAVLLMSTSTSGCISPGRVATQLPSAPDRINTAAHVIAGLRSPFDLDEPTLMMASPPDTTSAPARINEDQSVVILQPSSSSTGAAAPARWCRPGSTGS